MPRAGGTSRRGLAARPARTIVPVGLAGLATISPSSGPAARSSSSAVGWKRSAASTGSRPASSPSAAQDVAVGRDSRARPAPPGRRRRRRRGRRGRRPPDEPVVTTTRSGSTSSAVALAVVARDALRAAPACRAPRCSRAVRCRARRVAAASTAAGAPAPGWPTSRWSTSPPARRPLVGGRHHLHDDEGRDARRAARSVWGGARSCDIPCGGRGKVAACAGARGLLEWTPRGSTGGWRECGS